MFNPSRIKYIKSLMKLGDTIHAYCVAKSTDDIKIIVPNKWLSLFDSDYTTTIDVIGDNVYLLHGKSNENVVLPKNGQHVRDTLWDVVLGSGACQSHPLLIKPFTFLKPTVILCNRTPMIHKLWNGNWKQLQYNLNQLGFDVYYDLPDLSLDVLVSYIAGAKFIISVDTACVHIADAYSVPVIGLYHATDPKKFGPYSDSSLCLEGSISLDDIMIKVQDLINIGN